MSVNDKDRLINLELKKQEVRKGGEKNEPLQFVYNLLRAH